METNQTVLADVLTIQQLAEELEVNEKTVKRWKSLGYGPKSFRMGKKVLYRRSEVKEWIDSLDEQSTISASFRR